MPQLERSIYLVRPDDRAGADRALIGGKGAGLFQLHAAGLPIPKTIIISTRGYTEFLRERMAAATGLRIPVGAQPNDRVLERLIETWHRTILTQSLAGRSSVLSDIQSDLAVALREMGYSEYFDPGLAVRSSATIEDSAEKSYAGMFFTALSVRSLKGVVASTLKCWASLWVPNVMIGRAGEPMPRMAVVVQQMVQAEVAGVAFSSLPQRPSTVSIEASWGLAKGLVDGSVTPDSFLVDLDSDTVEARVGAKQATFRTTEGNGVEEEITPPELRRKLCLSPNQAIQVGRICKTAEKALGQPLDIEWTLTGGEITLVQARPLIAARFRGQG